MRYEIRSWKLKRYATNSLEEVAAQINPVVRGWINYYGRYCRSALSPVLRQVEMALSGWAMRKFKKLHRRRAESLRWLAHVRKAAPKLFAHWTVAGANG
jgi:RNA-directed DNA polymerase